MHLLVACDQISVTLLVGVGCCAAVALVESLS